MRPTLTSDVAVVLLATTPSGKLVDVGERVALDRGRRLVVSRRWASTPTVLVLKEQDGRSYRARPSGGTE